MVELESICADADSGEGGSTLNDNPVQGCTMDNGIDVQPLQTIENELGEEVGEEGSLIRVADDEQLIESNLFSLIDCEAINELDDSNVIGLDEDQLVADSENLESVDLGEDLRVEEIPFSTPDGKLHTLSSYTGEIKPPEEGMVFTTWELVESYFREYAKQQGFGIVRGSSAYRQRNGRSTGERRSVRWECEFFGIKDRRVRVNGRKVTHVPKMHQVGRSGVKIGHRKSKKCQCPVHIYASAERDGSAWVIRRAVLEHEGHSPTPSKSRHVAMFRKAAINSVARRKLFIDLEAGVKLPLIHRAMAIERNGLENMPFTQRDLRNLVAKHKKLKMEMEGGDAKAMVNYLKKMSADNDRFYHAERVDAFDRLQDVMWVDARSRVAFEDFGDVVCFDTTYITNKFKLPFANFVGVNHHGQTILFGCALLRHENAETFEWLFSTWLSCMGGKAPIGFLTDQCAAMRKALSKVMPQSRHRWCLWHILQKFSTKLGSHKNYEAVKADLHDAIYDSLTVEEFKENWGLAIEKHGLQDNEWLAGLFEEQHMWVPAHMRSMFWAGMKTTQRSESINSFFDGYVRKHTLLYEFISQYFAAMESRANDEVNADADCARCLKELVTDFPIEAEFRKVYTTSKLVEFQHECLKLVYVNLNEKWNVTEGLVQHRIEDRVWHKDKTSRKDYPTDKYREYIVTMDVTTNEAWCICKLMETHGIMCRHIIRVFVSHRVKKLPEMFVLSRWRKDIERKHTKVKVRHHDLSKTEEVKRYDAIMLEVEPLCILGAKSEELKDEVVQVFKATIARLQEKVDRLQQSKEGDNMVVSPDSVNKRRASVDSCSPGSGKKVCPNDNTTPLICSPNSRISPASPALNNNTPQSHTTANISRTETFEGTELNVSTPLAGQADIATVKDPPLPKQPRHRTTDSRYKSAAELNQKGTGSKKAPASKRGKKKTSEEADMNSVASCNLIIQKQQEAIDMLLQHQRQQQEQVNTILHQRSTLNANQWSHPPYPTQELPLSNYNIHPHLQQSQVVGPNPPQYSNLPTPLPPAMHKNPYTIVGAPPSHVNPLACSAAKQGRPPRSVGGIALAPPGGRVPGSPAIGYVTRTEPVNQTPNWLPNVTSFQPC